jgi:hypothetical protein
VVKYAKTVKNKGIYSDPISGLSYNIDTKIPYYALNNGTITTETEYSTDQEELNTLISSILKEQHTGSTLEGNAVLNNGIIMFTVKVP